MMAYHSRAQSAKIYAERSALTHLTLAEAAKKLGMSHEALSLYTARQTQGPKFYYINQKPNGNLAQQRADAEAARQEALQAQADRLERLARRGPVVQHQVAGMIVTLPAGPWDRPKTETQPMIGE